MRKLLSYMMAVMLAVGFASCSSDEETPGGDNTGAVSFAIEMPKGAYKPAATYSEEGTIANDAEWNVASIDLYAFMADGTFIKKLDEGDDFRMAETGENKWRVIIDQAFVLDHEFESLHFYFVGNDESSMKGAHIPADFAGTEADFQNLLTNPLEVDGSDANGRYELITINGTDENLLFSGVARNVYIGGKVAKDVTLKRREARFDILNDNTSVELKSVSIYNANIQGFIFPDATATPDIETAEELVNIDLTGLDPDEYTNLLESVFYLYPTKLGPDGTQIIIRADVEGDDKIFNLESRIAVEANKRYKLILDKSTLTFHVEVADYDEAEEELPIEQEETGVKITLPSIANLSGVVYNITKGSGDFDITVNSTHGTRAEVIYHLGSRTDLIDPEFEIEMTDRTVTYAYGTEETYNIEVPKKLGSSRNYVNIEVKIVSLVDDTKSDSFFFRSVSNGVMPAAEDILAVDESGNLNLDGRGERLLFRWGSLIGIGHGNGGNSFRGSDILWAPQGYDKDALLYMIGTSTGGAAFTLVPNIFTAMPNENNVLEGIGDPCKLASKKGHKVGDFRMPTRTELINLIVNPTWDEKKVGLQTENGFYPIQYRNSGGEYFQEGRYWSSTTFNSGSYAHYFQFYYRSGDANFTNTTKGAAYSIRCVPNTSDSVQGDE